MAQHPPELTRRGFAMELDNEYRNCRLAVESAVRQVAAVQRTLDEGKIPVADLRQLVTDATEAYQRATAWAALDRVAFMLPGNETKENEDA